LPIIHASQVDVNGLLACNWIPLTAFGSHLIAGKERWPRRACQTRISVLSTVGQMFKLALENSGAELGLELGGSSITTEASDTEAEVVDALRTNRQLTRGASYTRTDLRLAVALSSLKLKLTSFRSDWMILRRLFVLQGGTK